ncbi:hypothetical protein [Bacillus sp. Bva_UNVM-123]|uniref:hypothetical protein n=1 Tax=Bacillus sp. Bva_UNVM-123 TaxID=2829798 RepID=UPI00391F90FC
MNKLSSLLMILFIIFSFIINLLGLMKIFPLYFTSPLLFISLLIFIFSLNERKKFKGF